ncbi:DUF3087 family protein [Nitrincola tapanii]|uniref:DUF3087 family protein n=1 Tax=Nitrincola tapanii TaxID=1708751 RepID=A0A5A9W154_9GAMM|nr:DUF3087 family protein [Nitrincola tapanii]KAA0874292.1 DUF3087 family protein [Nitrincola tapanii]
MSHPFQLQVRNPETYREETRKSNWIMVAVFAVIAMTLATLSVQFLGEENGNNFYWNLGGVLAGLLITTLIFRFILWNHPLMDSARYGWQLKRSLMSLTNIMHHIEAGVEAQNPTALKALRFYHLGLEQMHRLEQNETALLEMKVTMRQHLDRMHDLGLEAEQTRFDPEWLNTLKGLKP